MRHPTTGEWMRWHDAAVWIDNWVRLGLVTVAYDLHLSCESTYDWVAEHPDCDVAIRETRAAGSLSGLSGPTHNAGH